VSVRGGRFGSRWNRIERLWTDPLCRERRGSASAAQIGDNLIDSGEREIGEEPSEPIDLNYEHQRTAAGNILQ
jgi:hypothetical protein